MYDSLLFDIDGTLWNASPATADSWNMGLEALGIEKNVTASDIEHVAGKPFEECVETLLPHTTIQYPQLLDTLNHYEEMLVRQVGGRCYPGVIDGIIQLAQHYPIFLISNCLTWYLDNFIQFSHLGPSIKDSDCYGVSRVTKREMMKNMVTKHALKQPVYIGDTRGDAEAAKGAGIDFIHMTYGFGADIPCTFSCATFAELVTFLL
jgi:phosphoglycolate phosphatase